MKQALGDKYTIAWFKLADCIARGEKERALGVYRLLSHSLDDSALARQLYGDILLSFNDDAAQEKYLEAATMYEEDNRLLEAAAIYEHLVTLQSDNISYREKLIELYQALRIASKVREYVSELLEYVLTKDDWQKAIEVVTAYDTVGTNEFAAQLHEKVVFSLLLIKGVPSETKLTHVKKVVDFWQAAQNKRALEEFVQKLEVADAKLYEQLENFIS